MKNTNRHFFANRLQILTLGAAILFLAAACTEGGILELEMPGKKFRAGSVEIERLSAKISVDPRLEQLFKEELAEALDSGALPKGKDLKVSFRFVSIHPGSRGLRWVASYFTSKGNGIVKVEISFADGQGRSLGRIEAEGIVKRGFAGGTIDGAVEAAAEVVAKFILKNFRQP